MAIYGLLLLAGGINKFDISKGGFTHFQESSGLSHSMVSSILQDKKGDFWFGTFGKGINKFDTATQTFTQYTEKQGLCSNIVKQMIQDQKVIIGLVPMGAV
ncbi:MAG: hypothetical protein IPL09_07860 [Bacteroidetes bacterium]|nr:hypothetical protein [Bacteroidota bacterium]